MMNQRGVSLIESLLVVVVLSSLVFLLANIPNAMKLIGKSNHISLAREIAAKQIEDKRNINFTNLVNDNSPISDSRLGLLPQGSGTVVVEDCTASICTNGENVKLVSAIVNWKDNNQTQTIKLNTMIGEGGIDQ